MNSDDQRLSSKARLRRDLNELRETFNFQQSEFKEQLAQLQSAHRDLDKAYKTLESNFREHQAQSQLAQSQNETKLAKVIVKLKDYKIQALEGRLLAKESNHIDKKSKSTVSTDESVDSDEDGDENISLADPPRRTDKTPESDRTPIAAPVSTEAPVYTCFICPKVYKIKSNFEKHQQTFHMQQNGDKNNVAVSSECPNTPTAKKRKKTVIQETDATDSEMPSSSRTTSESSDRTDKSHKTQRHSSHSSSLVVQVEKIGQDDQMSANALAHSNSNPLRSPANSDNYRIQERARDSSSRRHLCSSREDVSSVTLQAFPCPICQKTFPSSASLQIHKELHLNEDMVEPSHSKSQGGRHKRWIETENNNHLEEESVSFHDNENQNNLPPTSHPRANQHGVTLIPWNCKQCQDSFPESLDLQQHIAKKHKFINNICKVCSRSFSNEGSLREHMISHPGCGLCSITFCGRTELSRHFDIAHTNSKFQIACRNCGDLFSGTGQWIYHKEKRICCGPFPTPQRYGHDRNGRYGRNDYS